MDSREAFVALNMIEHVGPVRVRQLLEHFGEAPAILGASKSQLLQARGIGEEVAESISKWEKTVDLTGELKRIQDYGCNVVTQDDQNYPELLKQIYDPPIVLYVKGELMTKDKNSSVLVLPTPTASPAVSKTDTPTNETAALKEKLASLEKQMQDRKTQKPNSPADTFSPPKPADNTARANSPRDGFLALRSEPNSETGERIAKIPHGAIVTVIACPKPSNIGKMAGRWCQITYNGQSGWAFDKFMIF